MSSQLSPSVVHKTTAVTAAPTTSSRQSSTKLFTCYRCGNRGHTIAECRISKSVVCHYCGKQSHLQRACKSKSTTSQAQTGRCKTVGRVQDEEEASESESDSRTTLYHLRSCGVANSPPIVVKVKLDDCFVNMEVDTGHSCLSLSSEGCGPGGAYTLHTSGFAPTPKSQLLTWDVAM